MCVFYYEAGYPVELFDDIERKYFSFYRLQYSDDLFALRGVGDSMMSLVMDGIIICNKIFLILSTRNILSPWRGIYPETYQVGQQRSDADIDKPMYNEIRFLNNKVVEKNFRIDGVLVQMIRNF